ncbi:PAS domain S-box protein [Ideonella oryzae]|uniref:histidine kinase n=1 Tax=Ideonella oryzae TaxID=2937441 RepID=A0ABT1BKF2_9BURK|nr:PAS domain S-box protein [Ideonella oryzae]MCO5976369.1 PAS domain S-box protein [Ideonella oryzae]
MTHDHRDSDAGFPTQALVDALDSAISLLALSELSPQRIPSLVKHLQSLGHWLAQHGGAAWEQAGRTLASRSPGLLEGESQAVRSVLLDELGQWRRRLQEPDAPPNHPADERKRLAAVPAQAERLALDEHAILSVTDRQGVITDVNERFCLISGYRREELIGSTHGLLRSGRHPDSVYREMWGTITRGTVWQGVLCNRSKDGNYYWVQSTIVPIRGDQGEITEFVSIRTDITALKEIEERLRLLERATHGSRTGILIVDRCHPDMPVVWANHAAARLAGVPPTQLLGTPCQAGVPQDDPELGTLCAHIGTHEASEGPVHIRIRPDQVIELRCSPIHDSEGIHTHGLVLMEDVTVAERQSQALAQAQARLLQAQHTAQLAHWVYDAHCQQLTGSDLLNDLLGVEDRARSRAALPVLFGNVVPEDRVAVLRALATLRRSASTQLSVQFQHPQRGIRHLAITGTLESLPGQPRRWIGTVQDVSRLRQAEERAQKLTQVFDHTDQCICITETDGRLRHANRAARQLLGLSATRHSEQRLHDLVLPSDREEALWQIQQLSRQGGRWSGLLRLELADGRLLSVRHETGVIIGRPGHARYFYHLFQDCAKDLRHHEELLEAKLSAERANEAKTAFLSRMSHELRTPLNAILGFAQLMELDRPADTRHASYVHEILRAGRHLLTLINDVLDLSAIESGRVAVDCRPLAMDELLSECASLMKPLADAREIRLSTRVDPAVMVLADRIRLKQVLLNLMSNAVKYNRDAGQVWVTVQTASARVHVTVSDTGPGIPPEYRARLFQPFSRLRLEKQTVEGHGMGLAVSQRLVEAMQGQIGLTDTPPGQGCEFWIDLPPPPCPD